ncbi:hypothetical protein BLA60_09315 [Actinophytocola xinjiangensis]|uniref:DUF397 domain-containing protein n=1 Tax=Actinophytocola xinjiangensis TaxID=485602 RepID=A0A7Z1AYU0_9PSEU|nr:DUF397 domain-containing protein [Actinophytocola xinjiangensis]OLF12189.1 hypothetical protein BLA60_09315 [Actinophytocola xinjiangensis]
MSGGHRGGWFTSTRSSGVGSCVEVRFGAGLVFVRDSKDERDSRPVIGVPPGGWVSFLDSVRR